MHIIQSMRVFRAKVVLPAPHNGTNTTQSIVLAANSGHCLGRAGGLKVSYMFLSLQILMLAELSTISVGTAVSSKLTRQVFGTLLSMLKTVQNALL